jgi:hypothetical protein
MRTSKLLLAKASLALTLAFVALLLLTACNVKVKNQEGDSKKVDIETPVGSIHVGENADPRDTGLAVYPGARKKEKKTNGEGDEANVNISSGFFGVKVVVVNYVTDDPAEKVVTFYRDQLKRYGNILECRTSKHASDINVGASAHDSGDTKKSKQLSCSDDNSGNVVEMKVGTEANQHIVAVEPESKGTSFAMVYVSARGEHEKI